MAYDKIMHIDNASHMKRAIQYIMQFSKTGQGTLISGVGIFSASPKMVYDQFMSTKEFFKKLDGRQAYQVIHSYKPGEVDPALAHQISVEFAQRAFPDCEMVICTHDDEPQINTHIIINSVSPITGLKFRDPKDQSELKRIREISNEISRKYGLSVILDPKPNVKHREPSFPELKPERAHRRTVRSYIYEDFDAAIQTATSLDDFYRILQEDMGYEVERFTVHGEPLAHPGVKPPGRSKPFRLYKFIDGYTEEDVERRIAERLAGMEEGQEDLPSNSKGSSSFGLPNKVSLPPAPSYYKGGRGTAQGFHRSQVRYIGYFIRRHDWTGLALSYVQYRYILQRVQWQSYPRYAAPELRDELRLLNQYSEETLLLVRNKINTLEDLEAHRSSLQGEISETYRQINRLSSKLTRSRKTPLTNDERADIKTEIQQLRQKVRPLVHEKKLWDDIQTRSQQVERTVKAEQEYALEHELSYQEEQENNEIEE